MVEALEKLKGRLFATLREKIEEVETSTKLAEDILKSSVAGGEIDISNASSLEEWFAERFTPQLVWLDRNDYARALIRSLWLAPRFAATDFGGARQRDFAQVWTDTARGFLGEIAFQKFLDLKLDFKIELETRRGALEEFLPSDIMVVDSVTGSPRKPRYPVSIKTTKFNGVWLDLPGAQFEHSEIYVLVKLGISRFHFLAFLKDTGFLKDKLFRLGLDLEELTEAQVEELSRELPVFAEIPAYVAGFLKKQSIKLPIHELECAVKGKKRKRIAITRGVGVFSTITAREHPSIKSIDAEGVLPIEVEPIGLELGESRRFLAHSGALNFGERSWRELVKAL